MNLCKKFYKDALLAKEWMEPDDNQQKILALQSEINQVRAQAAFKGKKNRVGKDGKIKRKVAKEWEWKRIPPKQGEPLVKCFKGETYHWCKNHQMWCLHKPGECKLKKQDRGK
jgi:hypothetical protein